MTGCYKRLLRLCIGLICMASVGACGEAARPAVALQGGLPVAVASRASVGAAVPVTVGPIRAPDGALATLTAVGSYGPRMYRASFSGGTARFVLEPPMTLTAGHIDLFATAGDARGTAALTLLPGPPVEPLTPLVGGRSIIANGEDWAMSVVVPSDAHGNPVADGTPVHVRALHPGARLEEHNVTVKHLLAWARIRSGTQAGRTLVSVATGAIPGPEADLLEVAGWPARFTIAADPPSLPADGRQLITLRTSLIRDRFNNPMPDGTLVTFTAQTPGNQRRTIPTYTIDGSAEASLQAPQEPGVFDLWGVVYGVESNHVRVVFTPGPAIGTFALAARVDAPQSTITLSAGPILGTLGQYVPDGTAVRFHLVDSAGKTEQIDANADQGYARVALPLGSLSSGAARAEARVGIARGNTTFSLP